MGVILTVECYLYIAHFIKGYQPMKKYSFDAEAQIRLGSKHCVLVVRHARKPYNRKIFWKKNEEKQKAARMKASTSTKIKPLSVKPMF